MNIAHEFASSIAIVGSVAAAILIASSVVRAGSAENAAVSVRTIAITPVPKGGPQLTPKVIGQAVTLAAKAGVGGDQLSNKWSDLETAPGVFQLNDPKSGFDYLGNTLGWRLLYTLAVIDTTVNARPADLQNAAWDDPQLIQRFHALIDAMLPIFNSHLAYLSIGNEVDVYFTLHPTELAAYKTFYDDAVAYLHGKLPNVQVGVTTTWTGAHGASQSNVTLLNSSSDVFVLTYYPLDSTFAPLGATSPLTDFPAMVQQAQGRPVILQEVGYPSSKDLGSSVAEQAQFVQNVFAAWQSAGSSIPFLSYFALHDFSQAFCNSLVTYYGVQDPDGRFRAFLCSLGLRRVNGAAKPGWKAFKKGVKALNSP